MPFFSGFFDKPIRERKSENQKLVITTKKVSFQENVKLIIGCSKDYIQQLKHYSYLHCLLHNEVLVKIQIAEENDDKLVTKNKIKLK